VAEARAVAVQQATSAWEALRSTRAQVESVRAQIRAQEIALDGVQREAIVGSRTTLDVLNAEQELLNARVSLVRALADNINASYSVASAVGRLTAQDPELRVRVLAGSEQHNECASYEHEGVAVQRIAGKPCPERGGGRIRRHWRNLRNFAAEYRAARAWLRAVSAISSTASSGGVLPVPICPGPWCSRKAAPCCRVTPRRSISF
jgi:hypothetical protein